MKKNSLSARVAMTVFSTALLLIPGRACAQVVDLELNDQVEAAKDPNAALKPTPHMPDGRPNLNGVWHHYFDGAREGVKEKDGQSIKVVGIGRTLRHPVAPPTKPRYKGEYLAKVEDLNRRQTQVDPTFACKPPGVPRLGPPNQIVQTPELLTFLYSDLTGNYFRVIYTNGRKPDTGGDRTYNGVSVGHWENNTLVVEVTHFNDDTWLADNGFFHTKDLHVTERLTRKGNTLEYQAIVEDPAVLAEPWKMTPRTLTLQGDDVEEAPPCVEMDRPNLTDDSHHDNLR